MNLATGCIKRITKKEREVDRGRERERKGKIACECVVVGFWSGAER